MNLKVLASLLLILLLLVGPTPISARGGNSGSGSGGGGSGNSGPGGSGAGGDRVRIEVRTGEDEPEENRVRVEVRGEGANVEEAINLINQLNIPDDVNRVRIEARDDQDRVRIELREPEVAEVELVPNFEVEGNVFEITGEVTAFTGGTVTIGGRTITINPNLVANFEQEGTIEVGEVIKIEGFVQTDGTLLAREIKANGAELEANVVGGFPANLLNQILTFIQNLM